MRNFIIREADHKNWMLYLSGLSFKLKSFEKFLFVLFFGTGSSDRNWWFNTKISFKSTFVIHFRFWMFVVDFPKLYQLTSCDVTDHAERDRQQRFNRFRHAFYFNAPYFSFAEISENVVTVHLRYSRMEKFRNAIVDLDAVLDEFEYHQDQAERDTTSTSPSATGFFSPIHEKGPGSPEKLLRGHVRETGFSLV